MTPDETPATIASIGEFGLLERIRTVLGNPVRGTGSGGASSDLLLGIGDDAALLRPEPGWDLLLTCDVQICGRHFDPRWMDPIAIGRRAMTVNLSDVAAMGGEPRHALVSLGLPGSMPVTTVEGLYRGFLEALSGSGAGIAGGNLSGTGPEWFIDITLVGRVERDCALTRRGARPGDRVLVTGSPGRSAAGLAVLRDVSRHCSNAWEGDLHQEIDRFLAAHSWARPLVDAFVQPRARGEVGRHLARAGDRPVSALVDLSDGVVGDLTRICECSGVRARIDADRFPPDADLEAAAAYFGRSRAGWTVSPGDDYELLLTVRAACADRLAAELRQATGLAVTEVGEILPARPVSSRPEPGSVLVEVEGVPPESNPVSGWDHFPAGR